ncbi:MAG TPA: non-homologous end-joining DNA ligase [Chthoniobacterales bacterium]|nr:non-homologous end-joining DNA ligase [Chthoniobacterales bacterium]
MAQKTAVEVDGRRLSLTNLDKIFYPKAGFSKADLIHYYVQIAPYLLPHLNDRAITMKRYPDGVDGEYFYEKEAPSHRPDWVQTTKVAKGSGDSINYCMINDLPSLVWIANLADLELHTFLHQAPDDDRPNMMAFDLDPGPPADIVLCCEVGLYLKAIFDELGLQCFAKTSGSKGLQVYVPLNTPTTYEKTKTFSRTLAERLAEEHPDQVVSNMRKSAREGKAFIDWSQNDDHKTTVSVYSLRAKEQPTVSTPVFWEEVAQSAKSNRPLSFTSDEVLTRTEKHGDIFAPVLSLKQKLPPVKKVTGEK